MIDALATCWGGALTAENCCWPPHGNPVCFPDWDEVHTVAACCPHLKKASPSSQAKKTPLSLEARAFEPQDVSRGPCGCHHELGEVWFKRSWTLNVLDKSDLDSYCQKGLQELGMGGLELHSAPYSKILREAGCPVAFVFLFAMCGVSFGTSMPSPFSEDEDSFNLGLQYFMEAFMMTRMVTHCLDSSPWPLTLAELSENYLLFLEQGKAFRWLRPETGLQHVPQVYGATLDDKPPLGVKPTVNHQEIFYRINWVLGIWDAQVYWREMMRKKALHIVAPHSWSHLDLCTQLPEEAEKEHTYSNFRVLHIGSGPSAGDRDMTCGQRKGEVIACDALTRLYRQLASETGVEPYGGFPMQCDVDDLWKYFPANYFHITYCSNALDHTVNPMRALEAIVRASRVGGSIILWHLQDVHPEGWSGLSDGQHQWGFNIENVSEAGLGHFVIWNHDHRWDVSEHLSLAGHFIEARLHKAESSAVYIEVKIIKHGSPEN